MSICVAGDDSLKPRKLLFLALVVVALGFFIYLFESDIPSTDERKERAEKVLLVEAEEVKQGDGRFVRSLVQSHATSVAGKR